MRIHAITVAVCAVAFTTAPALYAAAPQPPANAAAPTGGQPSSAKPAAPGNYTYDAHGRRDPFINVLGRGIEPPVSSKHGEGAAGWAVAEISVRGIVQSRGELVAMVRGPDTRTFLVHQGDKFLDGTIKTITPQGLIIVQEVNDPLSLVKQREIRKQLRTLEDTKP